MSSASRSASRRTHSSVKYALAPHSSSADADPSQLMHVREVQHVVSFTNMTIPRNQHRQRKSLRLSGLHNQPLRGCAYSPNGNVLCLVSDDNSASLVDAHSGERKHWLQDLHSSAIFSCEFSPSGATQPTLCLVSKDTSASLVDATTGKLIKRLEGFHTSAIRDCAYSPDGGTLCLVSEDKTASLIKVPTGQLIRKLEGHHDDGILACAFCPDGDTKGQLCCVSRDHSASLYTVVDTDESMKLDEIHSDWIRDCAYSPDGETLCLVSADASASLVDPATGALIRKLEGLHNNTIQGCAYSPDGLTLCLVSRDKTASLVCATTGELIRKLDGLHSAGIVECAFSQDGVTLCLVSGDMTATLVDIKGDMIQKVERKHRDWILACAYSPDGSRICLASADKSASIIDLDTGELVHKFDQWHDGTIYNCAYSPNGSQLCLVSDDKTASLVEPSTGKRIHKLKSLHTSTILSCAYSPDGDTLCLVSKDKTASVVKAATGKLIHHLKDLHSDWIRHCAYSPDGATLCLVSADSTASLLNVEHNYERTHHLKGLHSHEIRDCAFHPKNMNVLCMVSRDATASLVDVRKGELIRKFENFHDDAILGCDYSPDGGTLCLVSADMSASLVDTTTHKRSQRLTGLHNAGIRCCAYSPHTPACMHTLCLVSEDKSVSLLDLELPQALAVVRTSSCKPCPWPRWLMLPSISRVVSENPEKLDQCEMTRRVSTAVMEFPELLCAEGGLLLQKCVEADNAAAVQALADVACATQTNAPAVPMRVGQNGRSPLRIAAERSNRDMVAAILKIYGAAIAEPRRGYRYAIHSESAPTLHSDLVFICHHEPACINDVFDFLESHSTIVAPESFQVDEVRMDPMKPHPRAFTGKGKSPINKKDFSHPRFSMLDTEVVALSIPGVNQPAKNPKGVDDDDEVSIAGKYLLDTVLESKDSRAVESDIIAAIIAHQWSHFGQKYAIREGVVFVIFFLVPFLVFCGLLVKEEEEAYNDDDDQSFLQQQRARMLALLVLPQCWILRQLCQEFIQCRGDRKKYFSHIWNFVDVFYTLTFTATGVFYCAAIHWWCKQLAALTVLAVFTKSMHFMQAWPALGRLVQLNVAVVGSMTYFIIILSVAAFGFAYAFLLVFSDDTSVLWEHVALNSTTNTTSTKSRNGGLNFQSVPAALFRSFTTVLGDFDVDEMWASNVPARLVFLVAIVLGNIVMLNLLIAIVSDEFDRYMEQSSVEAQVALGMWCKDARRVDHLDKGFKSGDLDHVLTKFPRHMLVLRKRGDQAKKWSGRVSAVTNVVKSRIKGLDEKVNKLDVSLQQLDTKMTTKIEHLETELSQKLDSLVHLVKAEMAKKQY